MQELPFQEVPEGQDGLQVHVPISHVIPPPHPEAGAGQDEVLPDPPEDELGAESVIHVFPSQLVPEGQEGLHVHVPLSHVRPL